MVAQIDHDQRFLFCIWLGVGGKRQNAVNCILKKKGKHFGHCPYLYSETSAKTKWYTSYIFWILFCNLSIKVYDIIDAADSDFGDEIGSFTHLPSHTIPTHTLCMIHSTTFHSLTVADKDYKAKEKWVVNSGKDIKYNMAQGVSLGHVGGGPKWHCQSEQKSQCTHQDPTQLNNSGTCARTGNSQKFLHWHKVSWCNVMFSKNNDLNWRIYDINLA